MLVSDITVLYLDLLCDVVVMLILPLLLGSRMEQCNSLTSRYTEFLSDRWPWLSAANFIYSSHLASACGAGVSRTFTEGTSRKSCLLLSTFIVPGILGAVVITSYDMNAKSEEGHLSISVNTMQQLMIFQFQSTWQGDLPTWWRGERIPFNSFFRGSKGKFRRKWSPGHIKFHAKLGPHIPSASLLLEEITSCCTWTRSSAYMFWMQKFNAWYCKEHKASFTRPSVPS